MAKYPGVLAHLPPELAYLIGPAERFGRYHFDADMVSFLKDATEAETAELGAIANRVMENGDFKKVMAFLDRFSMTEHEEAADLYFLFGLLDMADLRFD